MATLLETFANPGSAYRGKPFWAWNGKLEVDEVVRQIEVMKGMGLGGFFMHSRVGLATPFLSDEWFKVVDACVEAGRRLDMEAWLYDEDRWPSGACGSLVTQDERWRMRRLQLSIHEAKGFKPAGDELALFVGRVGERGELAELARYDAEQAPGAGASVLAFRCVLMPESPWYNGATYLDTLSPEAVGKFIELGYEPYAKHFEKDFGGVVPGVFTDEPNHQSYDMNTAGGRKTSFQVPWTDALPNVFRERYGYDLLDRLPEVFFDVEGVDVSTARHDFHDCTTHLFVDSFGRQIGQWCGEHNLMFTGHCLAEYPVSAQTSVGGSTLRFYEHMQAPGIDMLTEVRPEYMTAKQCASVAHQMGRRWILSETYGCTGWDFPFEGHKAVGDWQAALGVNLRCQHLSWYTMLGQAKRDYPASIFFQSPWWRDYATVEDYFARLHTLLSEGEPVRDVLVVHNNESSWLRTRLACNEDGTWREVDCWLEDLQTALLEAHIDFDYTDEEMLPRLGRVQGRGADARLVVGKAAYKAVVVPRAISLRATTLDVLERFAQAGGAVVFVDQPPTHVDCEPSDRPARLAERACVAPLDKQKLAACLQKAAPRRVSVADAKGREIASALYMLRCDGDRHYLFVCNTDRKKGCDDVRVTVEAPGAAQEWDPTDGAVYKARAKRSGETVTVRTSLPPAGSRLFVFDASAELLAQPKSKRPKWREVRRQSLGGRSWAVTRDEPNAIVLDQPAFRIKGGKWQKPTEILRLDRQVREAVGVPARGGQMVQPWKREGQPARELDCPVDLRYTFNVKARPAGPMHLVVEQPERFAIRLNGHTLAADQNEGWWIDNSFVRLRVAPWMLVSGENTLEMSMRYQEHDAGLEAVYLTGEFGVKTDGRTATLTEPPATLELGDWTGQGFPFYSSTITYRRTIRPKRGKGESVFLTLPDQAAVLVRVRVNGQPAGVTAWAPYEVDLSPLVGDEPVELEIDVVGSRRNLLGPLHWNRPAKAWVGPAEFQTSGELWNDDYVLVPYGLMKAPVLSYRKK